jgi:hypothetical protein
MPVNYFLNCTGQVSLKYCKHRDSSINILSRGLIKHNYVYIDKMDFIMYIAIVYKQSQNSRHKKMECKDDPHTVIRIGI